MRNIDCKLLQDEVQFMHPEERMIKMLSSRVALNLDLGSEESIELM